MGRPRLPDSEKARRGTLQPCRALSNAQKPQFSSEMALDPNTPPIGLKKEAKKLWALVLTASPKGLLQITDATVLERYCRNYALYRQASKKLDTEGLLVEILDSNGNPKTVKNPLFHVVMELERQIADCEKQLGFTPASRARVAAAIPEEKESNEFDEF